LVHPLPLVSILLTSLNQAESLVKAIESVKLQDYPNLELVVCDMGSTDETHQLLQNFQAADERLRWVVGKDIGHAGALNMCASLARGSVLGWFSPECQYSAGAVRRAVQALANSPGLSMVHGRAQSVDAPGQALSPGTGMDVCLSTVFMQRSMHLVVGDFDDDYLRRAQQWFGHRMGFVDAVQALVPCKSDEAPIAESWFIRPDDLIQRHSVAEHLRLADAYFKGREDHLYLYQKPFVDPQDCGPMLSNLGQLFAGAKLQPGMRVLDFAAGSCWLSRILVQMGCLVTSCDASTIALEIGKELFRKYPPVAEHYCAPDFCVFDGETLPFADASFDRIVVNDAFHHVPNMATVLAEFARVLKPDGMVAMSEPGRHHSRTEESQFEMKTFQVIENDVVLEDLWDMARGLGFADIRISPTLRTPDMGMADYLQCIQGAVPPAVLQGVAHGTLSHSIFFLYKQVWQPFVHPTDAQDQAHSRVEFDEAFYLERYPDIAEGLALGHFADAWQHYDRHGRQEGRRARFLPG
jgi:SAM-dependent methyltransferase